MKTQKTISKKLFVIGIAIAVLMTSLITTGIAQLGTNFTLSSGIYPNGCMTVYKEGSIWYAKNAYGYLEYEGTNESIVINNAITAISEEGKIILKGGTEVTPINLTAPIILKDGITFEFDCVMIDHNGYGFDLTRCNRVNLIGKYIDTSWDYAGKIIYGQGLEHSIININHMVVRNGIGLYLIPDANHHTDYNKFFFNYIQVGNGTGIWMERTGIWECEANDFYVNYINFYKNNGVGIHFHHVGLATYFYGIIIHIPNSCNNCTGIWNACTDIPTFFGFTLLVSEGHSHTGVYNGGALVINSAYLELSDINNDGAIMHYIALFQPSNSTYWAYLDEYP